jgi:hypothetical protein
MSAVRNVAGGIQVQLAAAPAAVAAAAPPVFHRERVSRKEESYALALSEALLSGVSVDQGAIEQVSKATKARFKSEPEEGDLSGLFKYDAFFVPFTKVIVKLAKDVDKLMRDMALENYAIQVAQKAQIEYKKSAAVFTERMKTAIEERMRDDDRNVFDKANFETEIKKNSVANLPYQLQKARLAMLYMQYMFDETIQVNKSHKMMYKSMVEAGVLRKSINNEVRMAELYDAVNRWVDISANMEKAILVQNAKPVLDPIPLRVSSVPGSWLEDPFFVQPIDESNPIKSRIAHPTPTESKKFAGQEDELVKRFNKLKNEGLAYDVNKGLDVLRSLFKVTRQLIDKSRISEAKTAPRLEFVSRFCQHAPIVHYMDTPEMIIIGKIRDSIENDEYENSENTNLVSKEDPYLFVPVRLSDHRMFWFNLGCKDVLEWIADNRLIETSKAMSKLLPEFDKLFSPLLIKLRLKEQNERAEVARRKRAIRNKEFGLFAVIARSSGMDAVGSKLQKLMPTVGKVSSVRFV